MKKLIVFVCLFCTVFVYAQEKVEYKDIESVTFFGVDYTLVKLYGAGEEPLQYKMLFRELNNEIRSNTKTYNLPKLLDKKEVTIKSDYTNEANNKIDPNTLKILNKEYKVTPDQVQEYIRAIHTGDTSGYGIIMLCTLLDRSRSRGLYYIVTFNIATREIIRSKEVESKAAGNSFQTYWGVSIANALKVANK
ncbi:MAG: hypothetical protein LUH15_17530 [Tannerellaceae bacterium]|nr:hypothetical protein [Tannerellaceae bacterium]